MPVGLLLTLHAFSQDRIVTGKVTDSKDGSPVVGATVQPKGSTTGTSTNAQGSFSLTVPSGVNTLSVSSAEFTPMDVDITGKSSVEISLVATAGGLSEVVVVGYGTVRKRDLTGSVGSVQAKDFNRGQINNPSQLLQGKVPGLQITNSSGQPGGITIVKIRGNNSIRAGNNPLYVVDGVPLDGRSPRPSFSSASVGTTPGGDPLTFINPSEIASIDVLKDASASAIYGSRGANGVVLITTKKGVTGPAKIEVGASAGFSDIMRNVDVLDPAGYRAALAQYGAPKSDSGSNVDAFKEIIRSSFTQNYSLAMSGGSANGKYRASFFASDQDGMILKSNLKKYVANFNGQYRFLDNKLSIDFNATAANINEHIAPISQDAGSNGNLISLGLIWNPTLTLKRANGLYNQTNPSGQVNPLAYSDAYNDVASATTILANINAAYKITPWLEYRLLYGLNYGVGNRKTEVQGWIKGTGGNAPDKGEAAVGTNILNTTTITHTLTFNKAINKDLNLTALAGYEYWTTSYSGNGSYVYDFDYNKDQTKLINIHYYDNMQDGKQANLNTFAFKEPKVEIQSYFARAILNFKDKYLLTATFRGDGSNKFGKNNKYAYFPSVAAAWNITNEDFMKDVTLFNSLKLRAGYGETGNQEFAADAASDVYRYNSNGNSPPAHFGNDDLKWETVKSVDIGIDFALLKGRIYGSIDYFSKKTTNLIFEKPVSQPSPSATQFYNLPDADLTNKGVEVGVGADIVVGPKFNWSVNANVTFVKNEFHFPSAGEGPLVFTGALHGQGSSGGFAEALANNQPIDVYYLKRFSGFDKDGIGIYSVVPEYVGDPNPSAFMGFSTTVSYDKLSLNLGAHGSFGNKLFNNTAMTVLNISNINGGRNIASGLVKGSESTANPITPSTRFLESGSFVKLGNATVRYAFGDVGHVVKGLSVYVSGNNLFVISKYKGFDPEVNVDKALNGIPSIGIDYIGYPTQRTFLFGVNFSL
ncbi:MAG TPA: SusC/RagA family TonB-linked outer membrane protein [Chitinophagaceae bacterium]|nr:SusC/RagA family TonB-linked outer membrane protein [Chitinophagaceae bacterium]